MGWKRLRGLGAFISQLSRPRRLLRSYTTEHGSWVSQWRNPVLFRSCDCRASYATIFIDTDVAVEDGYIHNFDTNKLICANGGRVDLSLNLSCRQVAHEMTGLALKFNKITFRTHCSDATWLSAAVFSTGLENVTARQSLLINEIAPRLLTTDMIRVITADFPQFEALLRNWQSERVLFPMPYGDPAFPIDLSWGELRSVWVPFVHCTLQNLAQHPDFIDEAEHTVASWQPNLLGELSVTQWGPDTSDWRYDVTALATARPQMWAIPELEASVNLALLSEPDPLGKRKWQWKQNSTLYAFSAASVAIRFLESLTPDLQKQLRQLLLLEDRVAVASSPSHVQGLIKFYHANPRLCVQRLVKVWEVAITPTVITPIDPLRVSTITKSLGRWILETMRLRAQIPEGSFQLILDGNPIIDITTEAVRSVMHGTALQNALNQLFDAGALSRPSLSHSSRSYAYAHHFNGLYEALGEIQNGQCESWIKCNFRFDVMPDSESLIAERSGWSVEDWDHEWNEYLLQEIELGDQLPPYQELHSYSIAYW